MKEVIGSLVLSLLNWPARASIPLWLGISVYKNDTSRITKNAPSGILPNSFSLLMKCWVSL